MEAAVVEVKNLTKKFGEFLAVDNVSFEIKKGEIVGLLGPNGAGKTTTILMLLGIIKPANGKIEIFGLDLEKRQREILERVNFSSAYNSFPGRLTVAENLFIFSHFYKMENPKEKIRKLLDSLELGDLKNQLVQTLSSGQQTRLGLCKALLNNPELLFLDEPTASLDPEIAKRVRELLLEIRRERNISILYTSHNMEEITQMCDRVIFLNHGRIVAFDTPLNLTKRIKDCLLSLTFDAPLSKVKEFALTKQLNFQIPQPNLLEVMLKEEDIGNTLAQLSGNGISVVDVKIEKPTLEDVFLEIAKKKT